MGTRRRFVYKRSMVPTAAEKMYIVMLADCVRFLKNGFTSRKPNTFYDCITDADYSIGNFFEVYIRELAWLSSDGIDIAKTLAKLGFVKNYKALESVIADSIKKLNDAWRYYGGRVHFSNKLRIKSFLNEELLWDDIGARAC